MEHNIVSMCDGTGNAVDMNLSNVLKLFRIATKDERQIVYYGAGIGTIGSSDAWARVRQATKSVFSLATGYGLDDDILAAYGHLCRHWREGDRIFLFGFSRGAYTARAVAGLVHLIGLIPPEQLNLAGYGLRAFKQASDQNDFTVAWNFARVVRSRRAVISFLGVWDTVASVLVPRRDRIIPQLLTLPHTKTNPSVAVFRHAMAIDERRRMFRLNRWTEPQPFVPNPFDRSKAGSLQDIKQVWFAGVHADVGGGYPEEESALAKFPLDWMIQEACLFGFKINAAARNYLVRGRPRAGAPSQFVKPAAGADAHDSMNWAWRILEVIPKRSPPEWHKREVLGWYLPDSEPRSLVTSDQFPVLHSSVVHRLAARPDYRPENLPIRYAIEH